MNPSNAKIKILPMIGKAHVYDPARAGLDIPDQVNTPPAKALILPLAFTEINGKVMVVFEWIIEDPECPGVELQVDYAIPECVFPASDYLPVKDRMLGKSETARYNFARWVEAQPFGEDPAKEEDRLPRSADAILRSCVDIMAERGKKYDTTGQERSASRIAAVYNALKGTSFTAMDIWDLLMVLKLVRAQEDSGVDSRVDLTSYAALSAEEMESIVYGSGPSEVDEAKGGMHVAFETTSEHSGFKINGSGALFVGGVKLGRWDDAALDRLAEDMKRSCGGGDALNELR